MTETVQLNRKDFQTDNDVRWCPGCGDYAILATVQRFLPEIGVPRENIVFISGIGCAARFPYYMKTYGMHSIHGRAPTVATGLKVTNPELSVWVITGDGDSLSIGGNHTMHVLRRNVDVNILLFNNRIYGLTKGQYFPTSPQAKVTKSTPTGSLDYPVNPALLAVGAGATFIARTVDRESKQMIRVFKKAEEHTGTSLVEILQNCPVFNDGEFDHVQDSKVKKSNQLVLEDGESMIYDEGKKGIGLSTETQLPIVIDLEAEPGRKDEVLVHDETDPTGMRAYMFARMEYPEFPVPIGVFRRWARPSYDQQIVAQGEAAKAKRKPANLKELLYAGDTWVVE